MDCGMANCPDVLGMIVSTPPPKGTVRVTGVGVECEREPLVPVNEMANGPVAVADETLSVSVPELPAATLIGTNVTPAGGFFGVIVTVPVNPFKGITVTWTPPDFPRLILREEGRAEIEKSPVDCPVPISFTSNGLYGPPV